MKHRIDHALDGGEHIVYHTPELRQDVGATVRGKVEIGFGWSNKDRIELTPDEARLMGLRLIEAASAAEEELYT